MKLWHHKAWLFLIVASSTSAWSAEEPGWERVTGTALHAAFKDMELGDGVHFAYRFYADGHIEGTEMGKPVHGTWRTTSKLLCWRLGQPAEDEECHSVKRNGSSIRAYRNGEEVWSGDLDSSHK